LKGRGSALRVRDLMFPASVTAAPLEEGLLDFFAPARGVSAPRREEDSATPSRADAIRRAIVRWLNEEL
jgi:hypothetical protein